MFTLLLLAFVLKGTLTQPSGDPSYEDVNFSSGFCQTLAYDVSAVTLNCNFQGLPAKLANLGDPGKRFSRTQSFHLSVENASSLWITQEFQTTWRSKSSLWLTLGHIGNISQDPVDENSINQIKLLDVKIRACSIDSLLAGFLSDTDVLLLDIVDSHIGRIATNAFNKVGQVHQLRIYRSRIDQWQENATPSSMTLSESQEPTSLLPFLIGNSSIQVMEPNALRLILEKDTYFNIVNSSISSMKTDTLQVTGSGHVIITDSTFRNLDSKGIQVNLGPSKTGQLKLFEQPSFSAIGSLFSVEPATDFFDGIRVEKGNRYFIRVTLNSTRFHDFAQITDLWTDQSVDLQDIGVICFCSDLQNFTDTALEEPVIPAQTSAVIDDDYFSQDHLPGDDASLSSQKRLDRFVRCLDPSEPVNLLNFSSYNELYCLRSVATVATDDGGPTEPDIDADGAQEEAASTAFFFDHWLFYLLASVGSSGAAVLVILGIVHVIRRGGSATLNPNTTTGTIPEDHVMTTVRITNQYQSAVGMVSEQPICDEDREEDC